MNRTTAEQVPFLRTIRMQQRRQRKGMALWGAIAALVLGFGVAASAQQPDHYYVVIGVFRTHEQAIRLTEQATALNLLADYALNSRRSLYFVFALETQDKERAYTFLKKVRKSTPYHDAWVFSGELGQLELHTLPRAEGQESRPKNRSYPPAR